MTLKNLYAKLLTIGYPVAYSHFEGTPPGVPFLVYYATENADLLADDVVWVSAAVVRVELYTRRKDLSAEAKVEDCLRELGLVWSKAEAWVDTEKLFMISYETEVC